ncbi:MAG: methyltransferase domain-containing protein [Sulfuritalea sp.]|nr:methyltransferase domain-containing protein [Sulfuritalea sp.]
MAARLDLVKITPQRVADIGCATGDGIRKLQQRYPKALPLALDYALPMLQAVRRASPRLQRLARREPRLVNADVRQLPLASNSLGLVWSNLMLHWLEDPLPALRELHRVLEVNGLLSFATLGPDTVKELREAAQKVGVGEICMPGKALRAPAAARRFLDMHDLGDMLVAAGFGDPVMDMERITLTYSTPRAFLADQRHLGVRDALLGQLPWRDWRRLLNAWPQDVDGRFPTTFEIVYAHAWKPEPRQIADGRAVVQFRSR